VGLALQVIMCNLGRRAPPLDVVRTPYAVSDDGVGAESLAVLLDVDLAELARLLLGPGHHDPRRWAMSQSRTSAGK